VNLGSEINTEGDEMFPFIDQDSILYFSSNGHLGMGGLDIFRATDNGNNWENIVNLKYPINSPADDFGITLSTYANRVYFTSNRQGGKGSDDIYFFHKDDVASVNQNSNIDSVALVYGKVLNSKTNEAVAAEIECDILPDVISSYQFGNDSITTNLITENDTIKDVQMARSDPTTGEYNMKIPYGEKYFFRTSAEGFETTKEIYDISGLNKYMELENNIYLAPTNKNVKRSEEEVFTIVDILPQFGKGDADLLSYLAINIKYPDSAKVAGISGVVYVSFVVNSRGAVTDVKVIRGIGGGCDEEAYRVVSAMPNWNPGKHRGKPVSVQYNIPIRFVVR